MTVPDYNTNYNFFVRAVYSVANMDSSTITVKSPDLCPLITSCTVNDSLVNLVNIKTGDVITWKGTIEENGVKTPFTYVWNGDELSPSPTTISSSTGYINALPLAYKLVGVRNMNLTIRDVGRTVPIICPNVTTIATPVETFTASPGGTPAACITAPKTGFIKLDWTKPNVLDKDAAISSIAGYKVYRQTASGAPVLIFQTTDKNVLTYKDNDKRNAGGSINTDGTGTPNWLPLPDPGNATDYTYTIKAYYLKVGGGYIDSPAVGTDPAITLPPDLCSGPVQSFQATPGICGAASGSLQPTEIQLTWQAPDPATSGTISEYRIYVDGETLTDTVPASKLSYTVSAWDSGDAGTSHSFRVSSFGPSSGSGKKRSPPNESNRVVAGATLPFCKGSCALIQSFSSSPSFIGYNTAPTLTWSSAGANECSLFSGGTKVTSGLSGTAATSTLGTLTGNTQYALSCSNNICTTTNLITVGVAADPSSPDLSVSCSFSPNPVHVGEEVEFIVTVSGKIKPPYNITWVGSDGLSVVHSPVNTNVDSVRKTYSTIGNKNVNALVHKGVVAVGCTPPISPFKVIVNPAFEEI